jgi:hypothetical protein
MRTDALSCFSNVLTYNGEINEILNIFFTEDLLVGKYPWTGKICGLNLHLLEGTIAWVTVRTWVNNKNYTLIHNIISM